jgi:hypothetical protein
MSAGDTVGIQDLLPFPIEPHVERYEAENGRTLESGCYHQSIVPAGVRLDADIAHMRTIRLHGR